MATIEYKETEDKILDDMSNKLSNIENIAKDTKNELDLHSIMIESLDNDITEANNNLKKANKDIRRIHTNNNNKCKLFVIVFLIILIIILLILIFN